MKKIINNLIKIFIVVVLLVFAVWLTSYFIGLHIYINETKNIPKMNTLQEQMKYTMKKTDELLNNISIPTYILAGGGWRCRAIIKMYQEMFEYFPEANENVNALFRMADSYVWIGGRKNREKAISLYRKSIAVFKEKHLNESPPQNVEPTQFKEDKYKFLIARHRQIAANYAALNQYDKAIKEYELIIDEYSNQIKGFKLPIQYSLLGRIYESIGHIYLRQYKNYSEAERWFEKAKEHFPTPLAISINETNIGDCYLAQGDDIKAKEIYQAVIDKFKNSKEIVDFTSAQNRLKNLNRWKKIITKHKPLI